MHGCTDSSGMKYKKIKKLKYIHLVSLNRVLRQKSLFSMNAVPYFRRPNQNISGLKRIPDPGFHPGVRFPFFNRNTLNKRPKIIYRYNDSDRLRKGQFQRRDISGPSNVLHSPLWSLRAVRGESQSENSTAFLN